MRPLIILLVLVIACMMTLTTLLALQQLRALRNTPEPKPGPELALYNMGIIETHNADERWFVYKRSHFFPLDGAREIRTKIYYDNDTTFIRQVPRMQQGVYDTLEHTPTDRLTALMAGSEVLVFYTRDEANNRLRAFYIVSGTPLFASY